MNYISPLKNFLQFATAREFWHANLENGQFIYIKNKIERFGDILVWPSFKNSDSLLQHIDEPYMIVALTVAAIGIVTLVFYPEQSVETINTLVPIRSIFKPWVVKLAVFLGTELTILGFGSRILGRLTNSELVTAWNNRLIIAIPIGTVQLQSLGE